MSETFKGEASAEHRRYPRKRLSLQVKYENVIQTVTTGTAGSQSLNVSAGGLAIRSNKKVMNGQMIALTIYLPSQEQRNIITEETPPDIEKAIPVNVLAQVAWSNEVSTSDFMIGVQFLEVDLNHKEKLNEFLKDYHLDGPDFELYK